MEYVFVVDFVAVLLGLYMGFYHAKDYIWDYYFVVSIWENFHGYKAFVGWQVSVVAFVFNA